MKIQLYNIKKSYGDKTVLDGLNLILENKTAVIMGESGCGKTTLLRIISNLEKSDGGEVLTEGRIAFVFAEPRLFENVNVLENVTCVMTGDKIENREKAMSILTSFGLADAAHKKPEELSSGMAQRVTIARAVAYDAGIYLLDEPFRGLDDDTRMKAMIYLKDFFYNRTAVIVTHDMAEAHFMGGMIYRLSDGKLSSL